MVALEQRPLPGLGVLPPAGIKIVVEGALVWRGVLLLHPGNTAVLGGHVPLLEQAQRAAEAAWNEPTGVCGFPEERSVAERR